MLLLFWPVQSSRRGRGKQSGQKNSGWCSLIHFTKLKPFDSNAPHFLHLSEERLGIFLEPILLVRAIAQSAANSGNS